MKILLMDSDVNYLQIMERLLLEENYTVIAVTTIEEGLVVVKNYHINVILTNFIFEGRNRINLLENLIQSKNNSEIIVISENNTVNFKVGGFKGKIFDFFHKPFCFNQLIIKLSEIEKKNHSFDH